MENQVLINETPVWKKVLFYILCALFPVAGLLFYVIDKNNNEDKNKIYYKISFISIIAITSVFLGVLLLTFDGPEVLGLNFRKLALIFFTYYLLNGIGYLVASKVYFNKFETVEFKKEKTYRYAKILISSLTALFAILIVYFLDEIVTSFPKGFPFEEFEYTYGTPTVAFYAICILIGALTTWSIAQEKARDEGYSRSIFETIFYLAFPAGIIGARAWWVISEWNRDLAGNHSLAAIFDFRGGGLAIQGGVILGAMVGMWFMCEFHREMKLRKAMDLIIPGILLAQAIGRFGNFFNVEVYGALVDPADWWFIPKVIITHCQTAKNGNFYIPLFLIEAVLNTIGYFVLTYGAGKGLKKWIVNGDLAFGYLVWYGVVRFLLEPLRNPIYQMPTSMYMSAAFIIAGVLAIIVNHLIAYFTSKDSWINRRDQLYTKFHAGAERFESLPKWAKILLALPIVNGFAYSYYRFIKGHFFSAFFNIFLGATITWIVDIIFIILDKPLLFTKQYV